MSSKLNGMKTGLALFTAVSMSALITAGVLTAEDPAAAATETSLDGALQVQKIWEREHTLRDGRTVTCLYVTEAGLECDWRGAR